MQIKICSRKEAEALLKKGFLKNTAVISFYDPADTRGGGTVPLNYSGKAERVFYVPVHDIDIEILGDYSLSYETYFPEAPRLAEFIKTAHTGGLDILCQCEYGQSRSAACAAAIEEYYNKNGISVFADYRYYPNQLIFNKLYAALKKSGPNSAC